MMWPNLEVRLNRQSANCNFLCPEISWRDICVIPLTGHENNFEGRSTHVNDGISERVVRTLKRGISLGYLGFGPIQFYSIQQIILQSASLLD
jgi:hypothetical protein